MNVIITNLQRGVVAGLSIDIIKSLEGEYDVDELISMFSNFYFGKMILDITAIKNYKDIRNMQKLSMALDAEKIIVLLPPTDLEVTSNNFLSQLISMGIYNFTTNLEGLQYLYDHPNTYKDVAHIHQLGQMAGAEGGTVSTVSAASGYVLGIKNVTEHAGSTSLIYMLLKELQKQGIPTVAIELVKRDFMYFMDRDMVSVSSADLPTELLKHKDANVILVDLNDSDQDSSCSDVLYLIEPSTIKLNKLMRRDKRAFEKLRGRRVVLNCSLLSQGDINDFEYEAKAKVFHNIPPLNDRSKNPNLAELLGKIGILKNQPASSSSESGSEKGGGLFGFFKRQ